jgi:hypothetical protein
MKANKSDWAEGGKRREDEGVEVPIFPILPHQISVAEAERVVVSGSLCFSELAP